MVHLLRVIGAVCAKDLRLALSERAATFIGVIIPINFLLLFILFALSGGEAPIDVVMDDQGPLAQQLLVAMQQAHSFQIHLTDAATAEREIAAGSIVGVVTIPAGFDEQLRAGAPVALPVEVNNLNVDFTNDIRRAVPLSITAFYARAFPGQVVIQGDERDVQPQDTGYVPYLAVSIVVAGPRWHGPSYEGGVLTGYVFLSLVGTLLEPRNVNRAFDRVRERAGLNEHTLHGLRHDFCSLLMEQGVPDKVVAELAGHANPAITRRIYQHGTEATHREAIARLGSHLAGISVRQAPEASSSSYC